MLAANLANLGRVGVIYHKSIEQALVIFPALFAALLTVAGGVPADEGGKLDFKIDLGDPPPCTTGFLPTPFIRSPADTTLRDLPKDLYCKVAQNDPSAVRGARNYPCMEFPGKRAPTIAALPRSARLCADRQQPVAGAADSHRYACHGSAEHIPGQQVSVHPAGERPGSGAAVCTRLLSADRAAAGAGAGAPSAVAADRRHRKPGRRHNGRRTIRRGRRRGRGRSTKSRLHYPPPPFPPVVSPPGPVVPPPPPPNPQTLPPAVVTPPGTSGMSYSTYDQRTGVFVDPAGGSGVYAPGAENVRTAENWMDLMIDPRQV